MCNVYDAVDFIRCGTAGVSQRQSVAPKKCTGSMLVCGCYLRAGYVFWALSPVSLFLSTLWSDLILACLLIFCILYAVFISIWPHCVCACELAEGVQVTAAVIEVFFKSSTVLFYFTFYFTLFSTCWTSFWPRHDHSKFTLGRVLNTSSTSTLFLLYICIFYKTQTPPPPAFQFWVSETLYLSHVAIPNSFAQQLWSTRRGFETLVWSWSSQHRAPPDRFLVQETRKCGNAAEISCFL